MTCDNGRDGCVNIYTNVYPRAFESINSSVQRIDSNIKEITQGLGALQVPDDYLGAKVKSRLSEICNNLTGDSVKLRIRATKIDTFIVDKIKEHKKHRSDYLDSLNVAKISAELKRKALVGEGTTVTTSTPHTRDEVKRNIKEIRMERA